MIQRCCSNVGTKARRNYIASERKLSSWNLGLVGVSSSRVTNVRRNFWRTKRRVCRLDEIRAAKRERATKSCGITFSLPRWMQKRPCLPEISNRANITSCSRFFPPPPPLSLSLLPLLSIRWLSAKNTFTLLLNSKFHPTILFHKGIMEIHWKLLKNILEKFNGLMREIFLLKDIMPLNENKIHHQTES